MLIPQSFALRLALAGLPPEAGLYASHRADPCFYAVFWDSVRWRWGLFGGGSSLMTAALPGAISADRGNDGLCRRSADGFGVLSGVHCFLVMGVFKAWVSLRISVHNPVHSGLFTPRA